MELHVTEGNTKIGDMFNLSFPPIVTCRPNPPCVKICYALGIYLSRPSVSTAWNENLAFYLNDRLGFWLALAEIFAKKTPVRFRLFVGGDFADEDMIYDYISFALRHPRVKFLVYTKRYEWLPLVDTLPDNLTILVSMWEGLEVNGHAVGYLKAWFFNAKRPLFTDERIPSDAIRCEASCESCGYVCYDLKQLDRDVVLKLHGSGSKKFGGYF
jgi:hypothetical protein